METFKIRCVSEHKYKDRVFKAGDTYVVDNDTAYRLLRDFPQRFKLALRQRKPVSLAELANELGGTQVAVLCVEPHIYKDRVFEAGKGYEVPTSVAEHLLGDFPMRFQAAEA